MGRGTCASTRAYFIAQSSNAGKGNSEEGYAAEDLVRGCRKGVPPPEQDWLRNYIGERILFGNCRSLSGFDLSSANLVSADLRAANLRSTNLLFASLRSADLAILLAADLRDTNLRSQQLTGKFQPYLCNTSLPKALKHTGIDPNRDCSEIPKLLENQD